MVEHALPGEIKTASYTTMGVGVISWAGRKDYVIKDHPIFKFGFDKCINVVSPCEGSHIDMQIMKGDPQPVGHVVNIKRPQNDTTDILILWVIHDGCDVAATH